ncbi:MAG: hypothetical protein FWD91_04835 [Treponema sp.]|nr:hypothetical protein [Treponema sp.]
MFLCTPAAQAQQHTAIEGAASLRSFGEVFPEIDAEQQEDIFSEEGLINVLEPGHRPQMIPASGSGIDLHSEIMRKQHNYLAEILVVVPHGEKLLDKLDAYNALGNVASIGGRLYFSERRQAMAVLFEEATRIESDRSNAPIPDPPPAGELPNTETIFIRLRDANFGNTFYRAEFSVSTYGIIYRLTNFRALRFLIFTLLKEENLSAVLYMEPLQEGMLLYVVAGADVSNFVANRIDVPSSIAKRGGNFLEWVSENLRALK